MKWVLVVALLLAVPALADWRWEGREDVRAAMAEARRARAEARREVPSVAGSAGAGGLALGRPGGRACRDGRSPPRARRSQARIGAGSPGNAARNVFGASRMAQ